MKSNRIVKIVEVLVFAIVFVAGFGSAVWQLWNLLMPKIFSLPVIGFWQALGNAIQLRRLRDGYFRIEQVLAGTQRFTVSLQGTAPPAAAKRRSS